jgi:dihydrofolate reductase
MRKIVASFFMSLDGVVEAPQNWHFPYLNDEMQQAVGARMATSDTMLLGRRTYEEFAAYWADQGSEVEFADHINQTPKLVVSTTLTSADWQNSTLIGADMAARLTEAKQADGADIAVTGSPTLVRSLIAAGLLDELHLMVHPLIVGPGKRLWSEDMPQTALTLTGSETFSTGVLNLSYAPAPAG